MEENAASKLGYDPREKLLILHADDVGMCHSVNAATFERLSDGSVSSASIMAPCPWALEAAEFFKENKGFDVGAHSTLTSEWRFYRWRPLTAGSTLLDELGYLPRSSKEVAAKASASDVLAELDGQVEWLKARDVELSHLDTHMGAVYTRADLLKAYLQVAERHGLLPMVPRLTPELAEAARAQGLPVEELSGTVEEVPFKLDLLVASVPGRSLDERIKAFKAALRSLKPGSVSQVIVHLGLDTDELRYIIGERYVDRVLDYMVVGSSDVKAEIEKLGIRLIGWRDVAEALK